MGKRSRALRERRGSQRSASQQAPRVSFWVVAFLDLLGYRATLERIDIFPLPKAPEDRERLEAGFARAIRLRRHLVVAVEQFLKTAAIAPSADISKLSPEAKRTFTRCRRASILSSPGPDHMVIGCPLDRRPDHFPIRGVFMLVAAA